jgi:hypothetical protein
VREEEGVLLHEAMVLSFVDLQLLLLLVEESVGLGRLGSGDDGHGGVADVLGEFGL